MRNDGNTWNISYTATEASTNSLAEENLKGALEESNQRVNMST